MKRILTISLFYILLCSFLVSRESNNSMNFKIKFINDGSQADVFITNNFHEKSFPYFVSIEKKVDNLWKMVRKDIDCPCSAKCKKEVRVLALNETVKMTWDYKNDTCSPELSGAYRVVVYSDIESKRYFAISNEAKNVKQP